MIQKIKGYISKLDSKRKVQLQLTSFILIFAIAGCILLIATHATSPTPYVAITADSGAISGGATTNSCAGTSNGNCVVFGGTVPKHTETWAYDDCGEGSNLTHPASLVQQWVTYAESNCGPNEKNALTDCIVSGTTYCTPIQYLDTNWEYAQGSILEPSSTIPAENWWLHDPGYTDSAHRIAITAYGGGNLINQDNTAADQWFQNFVRTNYSSYSYLFMDDMSASLQGQVYNSGQTTTDEITTDAGIQASHQQMSSYMTQANGAAIKQVFNGDGANPYLASPMGMLNNPNNLNGLNPSHNTTNFYGLSAEGSPWDSGIIADFKYATLLDDMSFVDQIPNDFEVLLSYDTSGSTQGRRVQEATVLLGYSPGHIVSWADLETNSDDLAVWPEEGIYPTNPVQTMSDPSGTAYCLDPTGPPSTVYPPFCTSGGHNDLMVATDVYRREFKTCYNQGVEFGPCAAIVNVSSSPVTIQSSWLTQSYAHEITFNGGDIQSGGTLNLTGASFTPGTTTLAAGDAVLLAP